MSSSSDDIRIVEAPAGSSTSRQRSTSRTGLSATKPQRPRSTSKTKREASSDSDEPVFVGSSVGAKLADKFTFKQAVRPPSRSRSRSALVDGPDATNAEAGPSRIGKGEDVKDEKKPVRKRVTKTDSKPGLGLNEVLLPELNLEPLPIPSWLGPAKILKELPVCPLCRKQLKASESGPARWRHISTCLPPLHRPPNPPPDLQRVISIALEAVKAPLGPASLIDYHMKAHGDSADLASSGTALIPDYLTGNVAPRTSKKAGKVKAPAATVGLRIATVEPADQRIDWDSQIDQRLGDFIGHPSPSSTKSGELLSSPIFHSTQPLGNSALGSQPPALPGARRCQTIQKPPFRPGEAREPMGASPEPSDRPIWAGQTDMGQNGSEWRKEKAVLSGEARAPDSDVRVKRTRRRAKSSTKSPARPRTPTRDVPSSPETGDEISPNTTITSNLTMTPRNIYAPPSRASATPTFAPPESPSFARDGVEAHAAEHDVEGWGDEAMLSWSGGEGYHSADEDALSHVSLDSGVTDDDLETWGRDAVIDFTYDSGHSSPSISVEYGHIDAEDEPLELRESSPDTPIEELEGLVDQAGGGEETREELFARGMPDYESWDIPKLQKLTDKYGYRPMTKHTTLVKIATDCWKAIHPREAAISPKTKAKPKKRAARAARPAPESQDSITSADIPLATATAKAKPKTKRKGKTKAAEVEMPDPTPAVELEKQFFDLIYNDRELYTRILRYEPISFDEFISKALASGITHRSYKARLAKFLDQQGITYYTQDPTGQRKRR